MVSMRHFVLLALLAVMQTRASTAGGEVPVSRRERRIKGVQPLPQGFRRRAVHKGKGSDVDLPTDEPIVEQFGPDSTKVPSSPSPTKEPTKPTSKGLPSPTSEPSSQSEESSPEQEEQEPTTQEPESSPVVQPTATPSVVTTPPSVAPAASQSSNLLSPSEVVAEKERTRALLPFSLKLKGQFRVDDVDQIMEMYLHQRLSIPFSNLEWILLTVTSEESRRWDRSLVEKTYDFTGYALFFESDNYPTEQQVQKAQLKALQDFHLLRDFVITQDFDWEIESVILDGMTIDEEGIILGDSKIVNDGDSLVRGENGNDSTSDTNSVALALSLVALFVVLVIIAYVLYRRAHAGQQGKDDVDSPETLEGLMKADDDEDKDDGREKIHTSYEAATLGTTFDSMNSSGTEYRSDSSSIMDWGRVFALSRTPVEQTFGEVFEAKKLAPPKEHKTHEIVTLAPVTEGGAEIQEEGKGEIPAEEIQAGEKVPGDEDSYGYNSMDLNEGVNESFILSSPVAPGEGLDVDYGEDKDLTIDLSDFPPGGHFPSQS